ncbi:15554_t:CDS:2, partial [Racocetra fulgida]
MACFLIELQIVSYCHQDEEMLVRWYNIDLQLMINQLIHHPED